MVLRESGSSPPIIFSQLLFVGMYATLGMSMPSEHSVDAQDRTVIPKIEPPTRPPPVARVLDQASFHGIVVHVMQMIEAVIVL